MYITSKLLQQSRNHNFFTLTKTYTITFSLWVKIDMYLNVCMDRLVAFYDCSVKLSGLLAVSLFYRSRPTRGQYNSI